MTKLLMFSHKLRNSADPTVSSIAGSLSTRQLIRVAKRLANFPTEDLHGVIQKACLARYKSIEFLFLYKADLTATRCWRVF